MTAHRCLLSRAPTYAYPADYCMPVSDVAGRQCPRSAVVRRLTVPWVRHRTFDSSAFASASPAVWNSLHEYLHYPAVGFRRYLKTFLLAQLCRLRLSALEVFKRNILLTYLLEPRFLGMGRVWPIRNTLLPHKFGRSRSNGDPPEKFDPSRPAFQGQ